MEAVELFKDRREMCEENKRKKKKKTKALQQDQPKKNGFRLRLIHAA